MLVLRLVRFARALSMGALAILIWPPSLQGQAILAPGGRTLFNQQVLVRSFARIDRGFPVVVLFDEFLESVAKMGIAVFTGE